MNNVSHRTTTRSKAGKSCLILLLISGLSAGCASSDTLRAPPQRYGAEARVEVPRCPANLVPMCIKNMGVIVRCSCSSVDDFEQVRDNEL